MKVAKPTRRLLMLQAAVLVAVACSPIGSKGTMPPAGPNGEVDPRTAPDFIAVAVGDRDGIGYVPKEYLLPEPTTSTELPHGDPWPVYAEDLQTLIGHMVPGKGFVPLGVDPATIPNRPVQMGPSFGPVDGAHVVTLYVRNASTTTAWVASLMDGTARESSSFPRGTSAKCVTSAPGGRLVLMDRPPDDVGGQTRLEVTVPRGADEAVTLWIDVDGQGVTTHGQGVPGWWPGAPQAC